MINLKSRADAIYTGVVNTYNEAVEIEHHLHNKESWFGKSADQSGTDWAVLGLTPFRAISGANTWGVDTNDEAKVLGSSDTPKIPGMAYYDPHRLFIKAVSVSTPWIIRLIYGTGTMAAAITALQFSEVMLAGDDTNPQQAVGTPVDIIMPREAAGTKLWAQAWNATNNATIDFFIGIHEYAS